MLTAMARELVTENGVGESAAAVWRQIQAENTAIPNSCACSQDPARIVEDVLPTSSLVPSALTLEAAVAALKFGTRPASVRPVMRRREAPWVDLQFPLF